MPIDRRAFLRSSSAAALGLLATPEGIAGMRRETPAVRPARLRPGDLVGLVAPASATWEDQQIDVAVEVVEALGLRARLGEHALERHGYFAGRDEARAADINAMFADDEVRMILALRGGWGSARILEHLDWELVAAHPKIVMGFSDVTSLLLALHRRTGLVTFHGPNAIHPWNAFNVAQMRRVLFDAEAVTLENSVSPGDELVATENRIQTLTPGRARGPLLGGNLTVLTSITGSDYLPDFEGAILFLEDVGEEPYRVDRMLTQLHLAGILDVISGFVFGHCTRCEPSSGYGSFTITDLLRDHLGRRSIPAYQGAMIGHIPEQFTLPVGLDVQIDAEAGTLRLLEPAVT